MLTRPLAYVTVAGAIVCFIGMALFAQPEADPPLKVLKTGLGSGTVTSNPAGINCGTDCNEDYAGSTTVVLTASPDASSTFLGWDIDADADPGTTADCSGTSTCSVVMSSARSVRPVFGLATAIPTISPITPTEISNYLARTDAAHTQMNSSARFLAALPPEYRQNWILMTRSESLQTGTAESPRILLPGLNAQNVFTIGMIRHSSYPGSHPNAIEYMQWDPVEKNFRFHEIVLDTIPAMGTLPERTRGVSMDDSKCSKCHSTRNVPNRTTVHGTSPPGFIQAKNKPNWDAYDSWGGMMPFNRDRVYQGSVEAAAFQKLFNPWTWIGNPEIRSILEQLELQPDGTAAPDLITRVRGGANDGNVRFAFEGPTPLPTHQFPASPTPSIQTNYSFNAAAGTGTATSVPRGGEYVMLRHTNNITSVVARDAEGRGVDFFDLLGGFNATLNAERIADELIDHHHAPGNVAIDVRPFALAIIKSAPCVVIDGNRVITDPGISPAPTALTSDLSFFTARNGGMTIDQVLADTRLRSESLPRRKADLQKFNLDRTGDPYLAVRPTPTPSPFGLIQQFGAATADGTTTSLDRIRREVFRRPIDVGRADNTVMNGIFVDRELYADNTETVALMRYFLEPLGVSVDKWSMNVRGRSRAYNFADVFGFYQNEIEPALNTSLGNPTCSTLISAMNTTIASLAGTENDVPKYTDVQRIFNKSCIECHGGLDYPPYVNFGDFFDLSENENPPAGESKLTDAHEMAESFSSSLTGPIYDYITRTDERCPPGADGMMPCGGPALTKPDIEIIRRWIEGGANYTEGDPHIRTIDGTNYDFQSAGEFVLLRDDVLEIQARQTAVATEGPARENRHTQLSSCVSINTAAAVRIGGHRITYEPNLSGQPDPEGLQLRIDGKLTQVSGYEIPLTLGGRIIRTTVPGGIQIESAGGTVIAITPHWWDHYQVWYMNIDVRRARATDGVMGAILHGQWLPALPDGTLLGRRPTDPSQRYINLYERFADAWRVTDATSLFDYAPGTSTANFTLDSWPMANPQTCQLPSGTSGPLGRPPQKQLAREAALQHCAPITDAERRENCVTDVMITGEPGFANSYLLTEQVIRNTVPASPVLAFPANRVEITGPLTFTWTAATDADGDVLTYRQCVWEHTKRFTFNDCAAASVQTSSRRARFLYPLLVLLIGCALLVLLFFVGLRRKPAVLAVLAVVVIVGVGVAFYLGRRQTGSQTLARSVGGLQPGKTYLWKVIVDDGKGGSAQSKTWRFDAK